jgi:hypothetical protein
VLGRPVHEVRRVLRGVSAGRYGGFTLRDAALTSSGPKKRISGSCLPERSTMGPLMPGVLPGMSRSMIDCAKSAGSRRLPSTRSQANPHRRISGSTACSWRRQAAGLSPWHLPPGCPCSLHHVSRRISHRRYFSHKPLTQVLSRRESVVLVEQSSHVHVVVPVTLTLVPCPARRDSTHSFPRERMIRIPPRATSLKRTWKPRKSAPTTKNMPNGFFGYSISGRKLGSRRNDSATSTVGCERQ